MKIQDQCCSLEQATRLKELGINLESYFVIGEENQKVIERWAVEGNEDVFYNCYTTAELGVMLPSEVYTLYTGTSPFRNNPWEWVYNDLDEAMGMFSTEAEARAALLIHLLETGSVLASQVKLIGKEKIPNSVNKVLTAIKQKRNSRHP